MKKFCIILLLLAATGSAFCQYSRVQEEAFKKKRLNVFYARVGYGLLNFEQGKNTDASVGGKNEISYDNFKLQSCLFGGIGIEWKLSQSFYFAGSFNFGYYNSTFAVAGGGNGIAASTGTSGQWTYNGNGKINYLALQVPVTFRFYIIKNFFIGAGPVLNIILSNRSTRAYTESDYTSAAIPDSVTAFSSFSENVSLTGGAPGLCGEAGKKIFLKNYDIGIVFSYCRMSNILAYDPRVHYNVSGNFLSLSVNIFPHLWGDRAKR